MRELLAQDGRESERHAQWLAGAGAGFEHAPQRQVGLGGRLVEPIDPMRPTAVVEDPRQVTVEDQGEAGFRHGAQDLKPSSFLGSPLGSPGSLIGPN